MIKREYIFPFLLFIPVAILQYTFAPLISFNHITPDFILILLVFYTIQMDQFRGALLGFTYGFMIDIITGGIFGSAMFVKTLSGFIAGYFANENKIDLYLHSFFFLFIVFLCSTVDSITYSFLSGKDVSPNLAVLIFEQGLLPALYTALVSVPVTLFYPKKGMV
jgi:rod shape-determining protein MreD